MTIKAATISVEGFVLFCDGKECKVRGGQGLDAKDILDSPSVSGWEMYGDDGDLCPRCLARRDGEPKTSRGSKTFLAKPARALDTLGLRTRCRSVRTVRHADGRKAKVRCGLEAFHGQAHAKYVTIVEENRTVVLRWLDGEPVEFPSPSEKY